MNVKVSIIVPVYNCERYLERCVNSIINQTERNIELIFINDGSQDKSGCILDEYEKNDERIKVIHTKNNGVSSARNLGINIAQGQYISFVDADDWIDQNMIFLMYESLVKTGAEFSYCRYKIWNGNHYTTTELKKWMHTDDTQQHYQKMIVGYLLNGQGIPYGGCAKLFNRSIIEKYKIRFNTNIHLTEDVQFNINYFSKIKSSAYVDKAMYNVTYRNDSSTKQYYSNHLELHIICWKAGKELLYNNSLLNENVSGLLDITIIRLYLDILCFQFSKTYTMNYFDRIKNTKNLLNNQEMRTLMFKYRYNINDKIGKGTTFKILLLGYYRLPLSIMAVYISVSLRMMKYFQTIVKYKKKGVNKCLTLR